MQHFNFVVNQKTCSCQTIKFCYNISKQINSEISHNRNRCAVPARNRKHPVDIHTYSAAHRSRAQRAQSNSNPLLAVVTNDFRHREELFILFFLLLRAKLSSKKKKCKVVKHLRPRLKRSIIKNGLDCAMRHVRGAAGK